MLLVLFGTGCSGGGGGGATPGTPAPAPGTLVDWPTYGYNAQRTGESPDTTITPANVGTLRVAWAHQGLSGGEFSLETQPVVATNVTVGGTKRDLVYVGGGSGTVYAYDALTGAQIWTAAFQPGSYTCAGASPAPFGVQGTFALDRANGVVYVPDGVHRIHALDLATGADRWSVDIVEPGSDDGSASDLHAFLHTGLNLVNGKLYAGTSGLCDLTPWRGRLAVVDTASHALVRTFYPVYRVAPNPQPYSGGGVWGWGGASAEPDGSTVYIGVGNADTASQTGSFISAPTQSAAYGENVVKLSGDLASVLGANLPVEPPLPPPGDDIDLSGTPVLFQPPGCPPLLAVQGKEGYLFVYNRTNLGAGPISVNQYSVTSDNAYYMGAPAYSAQTGYLYASVATAGSASGFAPGLVMLQPAAGCTSFTVVAHPAFGPDSQDPSMPNNENPRSTPTVVNGVVFMGTPDGILWARDAKTGAALWDSNSGGAWLKNTSGGDEIRFGPAVTGGYVYVVETESASLYALTVNQTGAAATARRPLPAAVVRRPHHRNRLIGALLEQGR